MLANGEMFQQTGTIGAIEADFNNENGNIKFRADYPNPADPDTGNRLLRHGQTGTIKIRRPMRNALVIPQRATFELLDKRYVWLIDKDNVAHQTLITTKHELEDIFVVDSGFDVQSMSWGDGSGVPTSGENLVIVGADTNGLLHIRIFDAGGVRTDTFETKDGSGVLHLQSPNNTSGKVLSDVSEPKLPTAQADAISTLKKQLPDLLPPHVPSFAERDQVLADVSSIVGQTLHSGLQAGDKIVLEGVREVEDQGKVEFEFRKPEDALTNQKFHAE
jgi:hypothetical protein